MEKTFVMPKTNQRLTPRHKEFLLSVVQLSRSVVSDSLQPHGLQLARPPCPFPTPEACSHSCPSSRWCHPTISSSVIPFSSCLQSFPASGSFPRSQFFASDGQSIGASASASVLPMYIQDWFLYINNKKTQTLERRKDCQESWKVNFRRGSQCLTVLVI